MANNRKQIEGAMTKVILRIETPLHRKLKAKAKRSTRSLNSELRHRLRQSLDQEQPSAGLSRL